ncbi:hypothetical protein MST22_15585 [Virgibacillus halodenitrificans]|uniref:hypothetical protein n=1 Tax=Virgibacillus halodenitrificans TaxID=1482 RepID=UPI001FB4B52B|nr:hypothetical protein [Virgibacillus halodenitrificans]MCJ0932569.1 hypothetical protein [Virgibacillus halodenitrificans]
MKIIQIVEGSLEESKEEMKNILSIVRSRLSTFKKAVKPSKRTRKDLLQIERWEAFLHRFRVSQMAPVYIDGICINYKLYTKFIKKLKGFRINEYVHEKKLVIEYSNRSVKGKLELYDITRELEGLKSIPKAVIHGKS